MNLKLGLVGVDNLLAAVGALWFISFRSHVLHHSLVKQSF